MRRRRCPRVNSQRKRRPWFPGHYFRGPFRKQSAFILLAHATTWHGAAPEKDSSAGGGSVLALAYGAKKSLH